jgi:ribonuclease R
MISQNEFLELIQNQNKPYTAQEWANKLNLQFSNDMHGFLMMIHQMEDEAIITFTNKQKIVLIEDADFIKGILSVNPKGYGFVDNEDQHVYVHEDKFHTAMHGDEVLVKVKELNDGSTMGEIKKILKRNLSQLVVVYHRGKLVPKDRRILVPVVLEEAHLFGEGQLILLDVLTVGDVLKTKINKVLGHENDPGADILGILLTHRIPLEFPESVHKAMDKMILKVTPEDLEGRVDYRNESVITIDGEDAKDFDDAIHITTNASSTTLYVHIADVSHYVTMNSPIDLEAQNRTTSVYVVDRVVPMLPFELSNGLCSLMEGEDRLTLTCKMNIDELGNVSDYDIHPSVIHSAKRCTYTQVNQIFNNEPIDFPGNIKDMLMKMRDLAHKIRKNREANGAIDFDTVESKFTVNDQGEVIDIQPRTRGEAEMLIEDFMVKANETVAQHCRYLDIPVLYRVHDAPQKRRLVEFERVMLAFGVKLKGAEHSPAVIQKIIDQFKDKEAYGVINEMLLRSMSKAKYDFRPLGHYGLALDNYCHFTSPIRRYPDLIVHRMLRKYAFDRKLEDLKEDESWVEMQGLKCSLGEQRAVEAERDTQDMKQAEFMTHQIGKVYDGLIAAVTKFGFFVRLPNSVEGLVHVRNLDDYYTFDETRLVLRSSTKSYAIGQKVKIKVMDADKEKATIDFVVVESRKRF